MTQSGRRCTDRVSTSLDCSTPPRRGGSGLTGAAAGRFVAGIVAYGFVAVLLLRLNTLRVMKLMGRVGLAGLHEFTLWIIGLSFLAAVVYLQMKWRWTAFTIGIASGVALTMIGGAILYLIWAREMGGF